MFGRKQEKRECGRLSLRRLLLHSPLLGHRLRSAAHMVVDGRQPPSRPARFDLAASATTTTSTAAPSSTRDHIFEETDSVFECQLCLGEYDVDNFPALCTCAHRSCALCLRRYLSIEIHESRVCIACPQCSEPMHPNDIRRILDDEPLYEKYEDFMVRRVLAADPDTRWCPAPDCGFAVVAQGCASCPELWCQAPGCGCAFCYHCKAAWHPDQTCDAARREREREPYQLPQQQQQQQQQSRRSPLAAADDDHSGGLVKPCPRCSVLIGKIEDGSCNHMICCVCGSEFCWLCMKEISDLHYLSPSGCTFWGKAPWSRKKKLLWQLGTLAGAPLGIALLAGVAAPALLLGLPVWAGRRVRARCRKLPAAKRRAMVAAAVAAAILAAPAVAGLAVGIGVPVLLFYVYGVVPVSLCRSGGCGLSTSPSGGVRFDFDEDNAPTRLESRIEQMLTSASPDRPSAAVAPESANGDKEDKAARSHEHHRSHQAYRLEVTADVVSALRLSLSSEAASLSDPLPPDDASTRALAGSIRDYKSHSEAGDDGVSFVGPLSNADKHSICSSRSFRSLGKNSVTEETSESLDKSSIGSGPRNVILEENVDRESPDCSSLPSTGRRPVPKLTLKSTHKHFASFEEDVTSRTPPDVVRFLERTDKAMHMISKKASFDEPEATVIDVELGSSSSDAPRRPLSKVAMLRNIFFHGSSVIDDIAPTAEFTLPPAAVAPVEETTVVMIEETPPSGGDL